MRQLVICPDTFSHNYADCLGAGLISLHSEEVHYALIEREPVVFHPSEHPFHVLVRKKVFSCNYRDMSIILMAARKLKQSGRHMQQYYTIGSDFAGEVVAVGAKVTTLNAGDKVIPNAAYPHSGSTAVNPGVPSNHSSSELEILHEQKLLKIPDSMPYETAGAFTIGAQTVYSMINKLNILPGSKVLLTGVRSNTSLFALQALSHKYVGVYGMAGNDRFREQLKQMGLTELFVMDPDCTSFLNDPEMRRFIKEKGRFNYIIDPFADANCFRSIDLMAMEGKYITCGISDQISVGSNVVNLAAHFSKIVMNNISIIGNCLGSTDDLQLAIDDYENKKWKVVIDKVIEDDIDEFMHRTFLDKERFGKVVYKYN